jgi:hypothetical protein
MHLNSLKLVRFTYISSPLITLDVFLIGVLKAELRKRRKYCSKIFWRAQKRRNTNVYSDEPGSDNGTEV